MRGAEDDGFEQDFSGSWRGKTFLLASTEHDWGRMLTEGLRNLRKEK